MFPFRRSVADDVRALYGIIRTGAQSNELGNSSLSPGEGSFDLLDSSGNPVARYGDLDGVMGLHLPNGNGGWSTVQQLMAAGAAALAGRVSDAEAAISDLQQTRVQQSVFNTLAGRVGATENAIDGLKQTKADQSTLNTLAGRVGATETKNGQQDDRLDDHARRLGAGENTDAALQRNMAAAYGRLNSLQQDVENMGGPKRPPLVQG